MAFIIRKDGPDGSNWMPLYLERIYSLGKAIVIDFVPDRNSAKRFETCQEAAQIAATINVGKSRLIVEPLKRN